MRTVCQTGRQWPNVILVWAMGLLAAAQLGKMAALLPLLRRDFDLSLGESGGLASLIEAGGASLGLGAGLLVGYFGSRPGLGVGLMLIIGACLGEILAPDLLWLVIMRLIEALGYLLVVVSGPSMIAAIAPLRTRSAALALWSTFVPAGLATGLMITGVAAMWLQLTEVFLIWTLVAAAAFAGWFWLPSPTEPGTGRFMLPGVRIWLLGIGFGGFTAGEVGMLAMLPTYLIEQLALTPGLAGLIAGFASLATLAGSMAAVRIFSPAGQQSRLRGTVRLAAIGLLLPAAMLFAVFLPADAFGANAPFIVSVAAIAANAFLGLYPAIAFSRLPDLVGRPEGIASSNGVLAQFGAAGALLGPPLSGFTASLWGWPAIAAAGAACFVLSWLLTALAER